MTQDINIKGFYNNLSPEVRQSAELIRKGYLLENWKSPVKYYQIDNNLLEFPEFEISNTGLLRNLKTREIKKVGERGKYPMYSLSLKTGKFDIYPVHGLMMSTFIGPRLLEEGRCYIDHIDRNKSNYSLSNLRYVSPKENSENSKKNSKQEVLLLNIITGETIWKNNCNNWADFRKSMDKSLWYETNTNTYNYLLNYSINILEIEWVFDNYTKYFVSKIGLFKTIIKGNISKISLGYLNIRNYYKISVKGKNKSIGASELVAQYFLNNGQKLKDNEVVDHINTITTDNRVENLRITSQKGNRNNPLSIMKTSNPIKFKNNNSNEVLYFISSNSAARYLGIDNSLMKRYVDQKANCSFGFSDFQYWSEEEKELYKLGKLITSDNRDSIDGKRFLTRFTPIKCKDPKGVWIYAQSKRSLCRYICIDLKTLYSYINGKSKCSAGYTDFLDWDEEDWKNYFDGNIILISGESPFKIKSSKKQMNYPIKCYNTETNFWEYFSSRSAAANYIDCGPSSILEWIKEKGRNPRDIPYKNFSYWTDQDWENYKQGKIVIIK